MKASGFDVYTASLRLLQSRCRLSFAGTLYPIRPGVLTKRLPDARHGRACSLPGQCFDSASFENGCTRWKSLATKALLGWGSAALRKKQHRYSETCRFLAVHYIEVKNGEGFFCVAAEVAKLKELSGQVEKLQAWPQNIRIH